MTLAAVHKIIEVHELLPDLIVYMIFLKEPVHVL